MINADYWKMTGTLKPWGTFDKNAGLNFSFDESQWVATSGVNLTLQSVTVLSQAKLNVTNITINGATVTMRIEKTDPSIAADIGTFVPFTLRMYLSDGQHDDRTFYLLIVDR